MSVDGVWIPILAIACAPVIAIGMPIARAYARRLDARPFTAVPGDVTARLERMEQAIDSIAIEVERISEGQRFTTKLLSDRTASPAVPGGPLGPGQP